MMKDCPKCGAVCNDNAKFCSDCGYSFDTVAGPEPDDTISSGKTADSASKTHGVLRLTYLPAKEKDNSPVEVSLDGDYLGFLECDSTKSFPVEFGKHTIKLENDSITRTKEIEITEQDPLMALRFSMGSQSKKTRSDPVPKKKSKHLVSKILCTVLVLLAAFAQFTTKGTSAPAPRPTSTPKPVTAVQGVDAPAQEAASAQEVTEAPSAVPDRSVSNSSDEAIDEAVIFDQEGIRITAKSIDRSNLFGPELKLLIENDSGTGITVQTRYASVNGYMVETMMSADVANGKKVNSGLVFSNSDLKEAGISTIADMQFCFHIFDANTWDTIIDSRPIDIQTAEAQTYNYTFDNSGVTCYNENGIKIVAKGLAQDTSLFGPSVLVYIENNRSDAITVQVRDVSVNGYMVESMFSSDIAPGKKSIDTITFLGSDLTENGITDISEADMYFHIFNAVSWDAIVDTAPVTLRF